MNCNTAKYYGSDIIGTAGTRVTTQCLRQLSYLPTPWYDGDSSGGVKVSTLTRNACDVGSIPALGVIFPIFIMPQNTALHDHAPLEAMCLLHGC